MLFEEYKELKQSIMSDVLDKGIISQEALLRHIIHEYLVESKRIDHEDVTVGFFEQIIDRMHCKCNGYMYNITEERLQLFIVDDDSYESNKLSFVSKVEEYNNKFKQSYNFIRKVFLRHFFAGEDPLIESVPDGLTKAFISKLGSYAGVSGIDTVEIFLVSLNLTVRKDSHGNVHLRDDMDFNLKDSIDFQINLKEDRIEKKIDIKYSLVDLNFLYRIHTSLNGREPIKIRLNQDEALDYIEVADELDFKSYLTVLSGNFLVNIYRDYSSRLLEKNIRAFLDFKVGKDNVNSGMKKTIVEAPHKFVAFNNGLTITCNNVIIEEIDGKHKITGFDDFQIVNGGQTTASIYFTSVQKNDVSQVKVMAKVNMVASHNEEFDRFVADISNYSNAQNKVNKVDLKSNEPVLQKIKALSNTISTPFGNKWFYEKSRGELGTIKGKNNWTLAKLNSEYPKNRRFSNTEMAKYYEAWGLAPYKIKKGGEWIFADFLESIKRKGADQINKFFYENLIARTILFRDLERIHGSGKNALGQLRSAVVPYSISCLFLYSKSFLPNNKVFTLDFELIWKEGTISKNMISIFTDLMKEMYSWIDIYKSSTDISENTKREDLWNGISNSAELKAFFKKNEDVLKKLIVEEQKRSEVFFDFSELAENLQFHIKGHSFYKNLKKSFFKELTYEEKDTLDKIMDSYIINLDALDKLLHSFKLDKNVKSTLESKKTKNSKEKILEEEIQKKQSLLLKSHHIEFLEKLECKIKDIDTDRWLQLNEVWQNNSELDLILEDVNDAFNNDDFSRLETKALIGHTLKLKYQIEYLSCLAEFKKLPTIIDLYQLLPLYKKISR